jgi:hypothetical protein
MISVCVVCGEPFARKSSTDLTCSKPCKLKRNRMVYKKRYDNDNNFKVKVKDKNKKWRQENRVLIKQKNKVRNACEKCKQQRKRKYKETLKDVDKLNALRIKQRRYRSALSYKSYMKKYRSDPANREKGLLSKREFYLRPGVKERRRKYVKKMFELKKESEALKVMLSLT